MAVRQNFSRTFKVRLKLASRFVLDCNTSAGATDLLMYLGRYVFNVFDGRSSENTGIHSC